MKFFIAWIIILFSILCSYSQDNSPSEKNYSDYIQKLIGGQREYTVTNGRVDLITEEYAFEIERSYNWKEAIGQCLWYALQTSRKPGIILIRESPEEYKYFQMLNSTLQYSGLIDEIEVFLFPDDFEQLIEQRTDR